MNKGKDFQFCDTSITQETGQKMLFSNILNILWENVIKKITTLSPSHSRATVQQKITDAGETPSPSRNF